MRSPILAVILVVVGCGSSETTAPPKLPDNTGSGSAAKEAKVDGWSETLDGIRIRIEPPAPSAKPGETVKMVLIIENTGTVPRRVYMLAPEMFRATLSTLSAFGADGKPGAVFPEPHPHGYLAQESDFPEIAAGTQARFAQSLELEPTIATGTATVRWSYRNPVKRVEGGIQTLDGPTAALFGGQDIPGIWIGELEARTTLEIVK